MNLATYGILPTTPVIDIVMLCTLAIKFKEAKAFVTKTL